MDAIKLQHYNYDTKEHEDLGEVSIYNLVRSMNTENFADMLDDYCNCGMKDYAEGERIGTLCLHRHPTIQASIVRFCLGIILAFAKQEYTDARNEYPVRMAKQIKAMIEDGTLKMGWMI